MSYLVLILFFGPNGIVSFDGLEGEKNAIESNLITLKEYNLVLNGKIEALKGSRDELIAESQKMGYSRITIPEGRSTTPARFSRRSRESRFRNGPCVSSLRRLPASFSSRSGGRRIG
jgi:hypothetical protein